jgi:predicted nucleotidyltransferase
MEAMESRDAAQLLLAHKDRFFSQGVIALYFFGSRSRDAAGSLSDYDFAAIFDQNLNAKERFEKRLIVLGLLNELLRSDAVDLVSLTDAPPLLGHRILKEGTLIFSGDEKQRLSAEERIVLTYLDWKPHLERFIKETIYG